MVKQEFPNADVALEKVITDAHLEMIGSAGSMITAAVTDFEVAKIITTNSDPLEPQTTTQEHLIPDPTTPTTVERPKITATFIKNDSKLSPRHPRTTTSSLLRQRGQHRRMHRSRPVTER